MSYGTLNKNINRYFYFSAIVSYLLLWKAPEWTWAVYTPSYIGFFWFIACILGSMLTFLLLSIIDLRNKRMKPFRTRTVFYLFIIVLFVTTWFYRAGIPMSSVFE